MKILALDLATSVGLAFGQALSAPVTWSVNLGAGDKQKFARAMKMTKRAIEEYQPDVVAIEAPIQGNMKSTFLIGLVACVEGVCEWMDVPTEKHNIATVRKHFLGYAPNLRDFKGSRLQQQKQVKALVMNRCRVLGWSVGSDDCADAAAVWDYAMSIRRGDHAMKTTGGLFRE
jgi:Holliday junction resolvasome RuvABC endonuclease subunit